MAGATDSIVGLVPATTRLIDAELRDPAELAGLLNAELPSDWPPEHHDVDVLNYTRARLAEGESQSDWWLHYILVGLGTAPVIVGTAGYKGPPNEDAIEIGYSVVPSHQRRGIATAATEQLIRQAVIRQPRITVVLAHTLPELTPSIGVLRKLGFVAGESPEPGVLQFRLLLPATSAEQHA